MFLGKETACSASTVLLVTNSVDGLQYISAIKSANVNSAQNLLNKSK